MSSLSSVSPSPCSCGPGQCLLYKNISSQEHSEGDTDDKEDITPALLRCRPHELLIIDTEEKTDREDREKAAIEDLGHKDDKNSLVLITTVAMATITKLVVC